MYMKAVYSIKRFQRVSIVEGDEIRLMWKIEFNIR